MRVNLDEVYDIAQEAWTRLREELHGILGEDLVAMWAHGGTVAPTGGNHSADLDTYVILRRRPADSTIELIQASQAAIARELGVEWDAWYVVADAARSPAAPSDAFFAEGRDTSWAINRAHWFAGRYVHLHGLQPSDIVPAPTQQEIEVDLAGELQHIERHVAEGDTDPDEATYAILNGSRILHAIQTGSVAISKREGGDWALAQLPARWHAVIQAALRHYGGGATEDDDALLAAEMGPFVAMVKERLPN